MYLSKFTGKSIKYLPCAAFLLFHSKYKKYSYGMPARIRQVVFLFFVKWKINILLSALS